MTATKKIIHSVKGFNLDWTCRGFQFEPGATYEHDGPVEACKAGFHACENPLHVFQYYPPAKSRYAAVEQSGEIVGDDCDSKIASAKITIGAELSVSDLVERAVQWTIEKAKSAAGNYADGDQSLAAANGTRSSSAANGYRSSSVANGYRSSSAANGDKSSSAANGSGSSSVANGDWSSSAANGSGSSSAANGEGSVAMSAGRLGKVKGSDGNALVLVRRDDNYRITHAWAGIVGQNGIKPDTWYSLNEHGEPIEVEL